MFQRKLICLDTVTFRVQSQKRSPSVKPSGHGILQIFGEFIIIEMFKQFIIYLYLAINFDLLKTSGDILYIIHIYFIVLG